MSVALPADFRPPTASRRLVVRSADGTRLAVEIHGERADDERADGRLPDDGLPRPTVVLAHGWTCSASFWVRVVNRLRTDLRVVVYDQRGHGRSQPVCPGGFTPAALADDLAAVLAETVPAGRPAVVAGHSMGAMALVALAGRHPDVLRERVAVALLANTGVAELVGRFAVRPTGAARPPRPVSARGRAARERLVRLGLAVPQPLHALPPAVARALIADLTMSPSATRAERAYVADVVLACPPSTYRGFAEMLADLDLRTELGRFDVPALMLVGTRDRLTPPGHGRGMVAALSRPLGLVELDGQGHMTPVTAPEAVSDAVRRLVLSGLSVHAERDTCTHLRGIGSEGAERKVMMTDERLTDERLTAGLAGHLGMEFIEVSPDRAILTLKIRPEHHQPHGIVHGGIYCTVVETVASIGATVWLGDRGHVVGVSNQTDFLRAVRGGLLTATATPVHRGRLQQLWVVEIVDEAGRLAARGQVRLQNITDPDRLGHPASTG